MKWGIAYISYISLLAPASTCNNSLTKAPNMYPAFYLCITKLCKNQIDSLQIILDSYKMAIHMCFLRLLSKGLYVTIISSPFKRTNSTKKSANFQKYFGQLFLIYFCS